MKKAGIVIILSVLITVLAFQSCTKEESQALKAPQLPDAKMMAMDFNGFDTVDPDQRLVSNWLHAAVNVYFWTITVADIIKVPVMAVVGAFQQDAVYQGQNTWLWAYQVNLPEGNFTVELYGSLTDQDEVHWEMYVSKEGEFDDVLWVSGATAYDQSYSNWILNKFSEDPADPYGEVPFISIEYSQDFEDETENIRYTNIIPGNPGNGGYIQYGTIVDDDFPVFYDIYRIETDNYTMIQYDPVTKYGRVKDFQRFHDYEWRCWDANRNNIDCE